VGEQVAIFGDGVKGALTRVTKASERSHARSRKRWQHMRWAIACNRVGIPLAGFDAPDPMRAGAAVAPSHIDVTGNALRPARLRPRSRRAAAAQVVWRRAENGAGPRPAQV
jgi:cation transport ATPase